MTKPTSDLTFPTTSHGTVDIVLGEYQNGSRAVELVDAQGEFVTVLSVNQPELISELGPQEFFVKTWSENEEIAADAWKSGLFEKVGDSTGFLRAPMWKIKSS